MKLIIDINKEEYEECKEYVAKSFVYTKLDSIIANGTPLPKGHGRLIDADRFVSAHNCCGYIEDMEIDYFNEVTPTIIEGERQ